MDHHQSIELCPETQVLTLFKKRSFMSKKIMIVDDSPMMRLAIRSGLQEAGYSVVEAVHGLDALAKLQAGDKINLIICDVNMPEMDGITCTRSLISLMKNKTIPEIPIICCSANDSQSDVEACKESGMSAFISKPLTIKKVQTILDVLLVK